MALAKKSRPYLFVLSLTLLVVVCYFGSAVISDRGFGFEDQRPTIEYIYTAGATLSGILSSVLVTGLRRLPSDQRVRFSTFLDLLTRPNSLIALLVSPVVYYAALVASNSQGIGGLGFLAAFQNGFFWEQILRTRTAETSEKLI
jgi:hypothetical protein